MKHLYRCPAAPGFNRILNPGESEMALTGFALVVLRTGEKYAAAAAGIEVALVILGGCCTVRSGADVFRAIGGRKDVFSGSPHTVYLPADNGYEIEAVTDVEVAVAESPSERPGRPVLIGPEQVKTLSLGRDNFTRQALIMIDDKLASEHFFIGEAIVPPGNWGSFPPHRHEFDSPPHELDMEEIYFFRFNPSPGFGIQALYTDSRDIDTAFTVRYNDTIAIPRGYHPVVNAPGYSMYFLWVMTGQKRGFINHKDPDHSWIK